jgi:hypothetical protein
LDFSHRGHGPSDILKHYTAHNFTFAFAIIPILLLAAFALMFFIKETGQTLHENTK